MTLYAATQLVLSSNPKPIAENVLSLNISRTNWEVWEVDGKNTKNKEVWHFADVENGNFDISVTNAWARKWTTVINNGSTIYSDRIFR
jgi:hypothetical protein